MLQQSRTGVDKYSRRFSSESLFTNTATQTSLALPTCPCNEQPPQLISRPVTSHQSPLVSERCNLSAVSVLVTLPHTKQVVTTFRLFNKTVVMIMQCSDAVCASGTGVKCPQEHTPMALRGLKQRGMQYCKSSGSSEHRKDTTTDLPDAPRHSRNQQLQTTRKTHSLPCMVPWCHAAPWVVPRSHVLQCYLPL